MDCQSAINTAFGVGTILGMAFMGLCFVVVRWILK